MAEDKIYNAADFERYYNGAMPANEMHTLEKAALEDSFLADALEGYIHSSSISADLSDLRSRLNEKERRKNIFPLFLFKQNGWWRIAALLAVIAGGSYLFYQVNYRNKESIANNVSRSPNNSSHQKPNFSIPTDTIANNSITPGNHETLKPVQKTKSNTSSILPSKSSKEDAISFADTNKGPQQPVKSGSVLLDKVHDDTFKDDIAQNEINNNISKTYLLKGRVTDTAGRSIPFVTVQVENSKLATTTDTSGNFLLQTRDSSVNATFNAVGYATEKARLDKNVQPTIAMNENQSALSEVIVTAYGVRKKKARENESASKQLRATASSVEVSKAESDSATFDKYLEKNIAPLYDANNIRLTGNVTLSFTVNKQGRPENIKVVKSSCKACEPEAIKLLQNGPDWNKEKNISRNVLIKF